MDPSTLPDGLKRWLAAFDPGLRRHYRVAFSGGVDSHVLLHALATLSPAPRLSALHLDHAVHADSARWATHCAAVCADLGIPLASHRLVDGGGTSETALRRSRYAWLGSCLGDGEVLVTAHHRDDQAETVLLQVLRGTGVGGLSGMAPERPFAAGLLARPLLGVSRAAISAHAREHGLDFLQDPGNDDPRHDRNFLRHQVLPLLADRWPGLDQRLARLAANLSEAGQLLDGLADQRLAAARVDAYHPLDPAPALDRGRLAALGPAEGAHVLRRWLAVAGRQAPSRSRILRLYQDLVLPATGSGCFVFGDSEIRRYRDTLYLCPRLPRAAPTAHRWQGGDVDLAPWPLILRARPVTGAGLSRRRLGGAPVAVDYRTGRRSLRLDPGGPAKSLRKLFQERALPPWLRQALPRLSVGGELAGVPGVGEAHAWRARPGEEGMLFEVVARPSGRAPSR